MRNREQEKGKDQDNKGVDRRNLFTIGLPRVIRVLQNGMIPSIWNGTARLLGRAWSDRMLKIRAKGLQEHILAQYEYS